MATMGQQATGVRGFHLGHFTTPGERLPGIYTVDAGKRAEVVGRNVADGSPCLFCGCTRTLRVDVMERDGACRLAYSRGDDHYYTLMPDGARLRKCEGCDVVTVSLDGRTE